MLRRPALVVLAALAALAALAPAARAAGPQPRIVGGVPVAAEAHPWQVALRIGTPDGLSLCGGTLVAPTTVLTAAHCVEGASGITAFVGSTVLWGGEPIGVTRAVAHPAADLTGTPRNDVALLTLARRPQVAEAVQLVAPEGGTEDALWAPGRTLVAAGWGLTDPADGRSVATDLQRALVDRRRDGGCTTTWGGDFAAADMLCAGGAGPDTCNGDSGGPLLAPTTTLPYDRDPAAWRLVGVTSWGSPDCGDAPGVYARLAAPGLNAFAAPPRSGTPPRSTAAPVLTGAEHVGAVAGCTPGEWTGETGALTESLYRLAGGDPVRVATGADVARTLTAADLGARFVCLVSARSAAGQAAAESALGPAVGPTPPAPAPPPPPVPAPAPAPAPEVPANPPASPPSAAPTPPDRTAPRIRTLGATCSRRGCTLLLATSERVARLAARARGRRLALRLVTHRDGVLVARTGRLRRGRTRVSLVATDAAGNRSRPLVTRVRVR